jgi:phage terminase large subunit-like protein
MACAGEADIEESEVVYLGLDLSGTTDLTALVMVSATDPARVRSFFWKPVDTLREHPFRDCGSGDHRYLEWRSRGDLFTNPGRAIDPDVIASFLAELDKDVVCYCGLGTPCHGDMLLAIANDDEG